MQFKTHQLFGATSAIAVLCALSAWLHKSSHDNSLGWIPPLVSPTIPVLGFFILLLLIVCLPLFLTLIVMFFKNAPRPYSAIVFLGLQIVVLTLDVTSWSNGFRFVAVMFGVALAMAAEIYIRKLPRIYAYYSGLSFVLTIAWYFVAMGVAASAGV